MVILNIIAIVIGLLLFTYNDRFVNLLDKLNRKNDVYIERKILTTRFMAASVVLIAVGIIGLLKTL